VIRADVGCPAARSEAMSNLLALLLIGAGALGWYIHGPLSGIF
jgi:hypothetical protein